MNKTLHLTLVLVAALASVEAEAQTDVYVTREALGSGTPAPTNTTGIENATIVGDGVYFAPQYMPGYPTAATIFPRVVEVECAKDIVGKVVCEGYHWAPKLGRGEYLFIVPKMKAPASVTERVIVKETTVIKEVPVKPGKQ